ncbi:hypothetical protein SLEP1_g40067 [Rubroshorea leprosula]|uniref:Uncharacterized protein n=1 Tax=Rubroshorea leprosula TaxID=152421 RepID=A0AAV5L2Q4_9ROSI|nr:hypothetical protein SLEP1_g40067 [Rubroshorea leprosula]
MGAPEKSQTNHSSMQLELAFDFEFKAMELFCSI